MSLTLIILSSDFITITTKFWWKAFVTQVSLSIMFPGAATSERNKASMIAKYFLRICVYCRLVVFALLHHHIHLDRRAVYKNVCWLLFFCCCYDFQASLLIRGTIVDSSIPPFPPLKLCSSSHLSICLSFLAFIYLFFLCVFSSLCLFWLSHGFV